MKCGLEIHVQLDTRSKLFCRCPTDYQDAPPNTNICPVCLNQPGAKPHPPNRSALEGALKIALMLDCRINPEITYFMRKHYNYPDLPSGYQRTSIPVGLEGELNGVRIREVHIEEDPGQYKPDHGVVDFNRSGIPLIEIVTEPDMRSPEEARNFLRELIRVLEYSGCARGEGTMRADVNISLEGGRRVEIKNINSIKGAYKALKFEMVRQKNLLKRGVEVKQETRAFLESQMITVSMRLKEEAEDYRYIPDPDLPPMHFGDEVVGSVRDGIPEAPHLKVKRFMEEYGLREEDARVLTSELELADAFEEVAASIDPEFAALWMRDELKRVLYYNKVSFAESGISPLNIVELLEMIQKKEVTTKAAKKIIEEMPFNTRSPREIAAEMGLIGIIDESQVIEAVEQAIRENPQAVQDYHDGKEAAINFLVGQVMRITRGKAEPERTVELIKERI
ncbi:Asp-tRNA(Asn)/Glu-tRNA(Gln) amidotransferase subunit GatB [Methanothermobacter marburgensis]|uniref:Aspartyl/glutamyl-tRNA(Asn/Gln) amidotransferase subunit B n=1 Tax=Methanothermobacter marburgensis (strain ATCC BAA-927 / DSM 2133 / JCM 14651 / NBRC 100331 / OCM 82 / Marburg) TaxID=79929 RepID=D9PYE0_METTM|nr:Asp-tRNA(Asn)/Glu-tRNA(Gln) amidotransferase subunit GatB [Methanothermobacter marburgensis]ADL59238.1 predicted aspartyl/glutamyl-tRNA(Asn/Gln) amidotransferase, subunit B [Methanothermobacter marburgensis str. Marburg]WBF09740.1 Asp-tRNA(Asn)/Glu-tRNA(Gln) amidotransferase subunit GatB [Methanothermobacter marburgensis]